MKPLNDGLKQRLIGAIVLLALAVIFLPVLFDRERIEPVDKTSQIPAPPEIVTVNIADPVPPETVGTAPPPDQMYVPDEEKPVELVPEQPGLDATGVPKSWVLQIASYRVDAHAERMRDRLVEEGFSAYTRQSQFEDDTIVRVYVGPKLDKSTLIDAKETIDQSFQVESILLEFKPD